MIVNNLWHKCLCIRIQTLEMESKRSSTKRTGASSSASDGADSTEQLQQVILNKTFLISRLSNLVI